MTNAKQKPRTFEAAFYSEPFGQEKVTGTFTEEEHQTLVDFMDYAEELEKTPFLHNTENRGSAKMSQEGTGPISFDVNLPDWNEVMVFIHQLRPLILEKEPTSFYKVASLIGKYANSAQMVRTLLDFQKEVFSGRRDQRKIQFRSNEKLINSEKTLQAYLNGFEYHRDKDKQEFIHGLHKMLPLDFSKVIFVGLLLEKAAAIMSLSELAAGITGKKKETEFRFFLPDKEKGLPVS